MIDEVLEYKFNGRLSPEAAALMDTILQKCFGSDVNYLIEALLTRDGQLRPYTQAISELRMAGYGLLQIVKALRELYGLSGEKVVQELSRSNPNQLKEIAEAVQEIYGNNYLAVMIQYWKTQPNSTAKMIYGNLINYSGITDHVEFYKHMRYAGYAEAEVVDAMYALIHDETIAVLRKIHGATDNTVRALLKNGELRRLTRH